MVSPKQSQPELDALLTKARDRHPPQAALWVEELYPLGTYRPPAHIAEGLLTVWEAGKDLGAAWQSGP